jgi:hypothetical protein
MDEKLYRSRMQKFEIGCKQMQAIPEILIARAKKNGRETLLIMSGPVLTRENIKEIREALDERESILPPLS